MEIDLKQELKNYLSSYRRVSCDEFIEYLISGYPQDKELLELLEELYDRDIHL